MNDDGGRLARSANHEGRTHGHAADASGLVECRLARSKVVLDPDGSAPNNGLSGRPDRPARRPRRRSSDPRRNRGRWPAQGRPAKVVGGDRAWQPHPDPCRRLRPRRAPRRLIRELLDTWATGVATTPRGPPWSPPPTRGSCPPIRSSRTGGGGLRRRPADDRGQGGFLASVRQMGHSVNQPRLRAAGPGRRAEPHPPTRRERHDDATPPVPRSSAT